VRLSPAEIATILDAEVVAEGGAEPLRRATIASDASGGGDLFFGLRGDHRNGGEFAPEAIAAGAAGVVVRPEFAAGLGGAWVFAVADPLRAMQGLAAAWRQKLDVRTVGITGSMGKTTVKDIARSLLPGRIHANAENFNNQIGLPLSLLAAPPEVEVLVLEMAMRGPGQIAELAAIAQPELAVITNVGPVHLEALGSIEAIAAAKAEILRDLPPEGIAVVPSQAGKLEPHLEQAPALLRFGPGGDVEAERARVVEGRTEALVTTPAGAQQFSFPFDQAYNLGNALAAVAAGVALGADLEEMADSAARIEFSRFRNERLELGDGIVLVNDCYNASPEAMRAALDHLVTLGADRSVAVLGEMGELGSGSAGYHREVGEYARSVGVELVIGVGLPARDYDPDELVADPGEAAELLAARLEPGDAVLVKGSRSAGLEAVAEQLPDLVAAEDS